MIQNKYILNKCLKLNNSKIQVELLFKLLNNARSTSRKLYIFSLIFLCLSLVRYININPQSDNLSIFTIWKIISSSQINQFLLSCFILSVITQTLANIIITDSISKNKILIDMLYITECNHMFNQYLNKFISYNLISTLISSLYIMNSLLLIIFTHLLPTENAIVIALTICIINSLTITAVMILHTKFNNDRKLIKIIKDQLMISISKKNKN